MPNHVPVPAQKILELQDLLLKDGGRLELSQGGGTYVYAKMTVDTGSPYGYGTALGELFKRFRALGKHASAFDPVFSKPDPDGVGADQHVVHDTQQPLSIGQYNRLCKEIPSLHGTHPSLYPEKFIQFAEDKGYELAIICGGDKSTWLLTDRFTVKCRSRGRVPIVNKDSSLSRAMAGAIIGCMEDQKRNGNVSMKDTVWP